mmetsp:Transcript_6093/g.9043  ORF Transcript_6093/g.9043 Transcript_6093/m.9043 type:complete len:349 (-) Transcript_6093:2526-3572(-)
MMKFLLVVAQFLVMTRGLLPKATAPAKPLALFTAKESRPIVLYDGTCPRCNAWVNFLLEHDNEEKLRFAAIGSAVGASLMDHVGLPRDTDAVLLVERDEYFLRSDAFLRILEYTDLASYASVAKIFPKSIRDIVLRANREKFGESEQCFVEALDDRFLTRTPPVSEMPSLFLDDPRPILIYDGRCKLCDSWVSFLLNQDPGARLRFAASQTDAGIKLKQYAKIEIDALVFIGSDRALLNADAILACLLQIYDAPKDSLSRNPSLALAVRFAQFFAPPPIRDAVFDLVSKNRHKLFQDYDFCKISDDIYPDRFLFLSDARNVENFPLVIDDNEGNFSVNHNEEVATSMI